ncbi:MAG: ROK family transcriptional regulator [Rhizobacter sp.]
MSSDVHASETAAGRPPLRPRGSNQMGMAQFNERVVLQAIRLHGALPQAQIARLTHLTAQTVSLILARLESAGLLLRLAPVRGKVGQPSVPIALDPEGAFSIGINVGRRSLDVLLIDFQGDVRERTTVNYRYPNPDEVMAEIEKHVKAMRKRLGMAKRDRLQGIGVAAPLQLDGWASLLGVTPGVSWAGIDLAARVGRMSGLPTSFVKDTAAACVAELVAGRGRSLKTFLYVFVGTFIGGGLVIDSQLRSGLHGNAGAVGSHAMGRGERGQARPPEQLLSVASLLSLETAYESAGLDAAAVGDERSLQSPWRPHTDAWLAQAAPAIAMVLHNAACLLDLDGVIVDGSISRALLERLNHDVSAALALYNWEGTQRPQLLPGAVGPDARALGGALLPLHANFAPDRELFLKLERA